MAKKILRVASFGILGGNLFGLKKSKPDATAQGPQVMPLPDDQTILNARKKAIAAQMQRGGRTSTILTDGASGGNTLGG